VFSSLSTFESMRITKEDYDENGPAIAIKKGACFVDQQIIMK
jgi:actin-related protein